MKLLNATLGALMVGLVSVPAFADNDGKHHKGGNNECPVGLVSGISLDDEFGLGTQELTKCLEKRHNVKMVVQINQFCTNQANCASTPYALTNLENIIDDYEITHGMKAGQDYEIVVILHSPGGLMALKNKSYNGGLKNLNDSNDDVPPELIDGRNPFEGRIRALMEDGVKFYFCQNTTRAFIKNGTLPRYQTTGVSATAQMIEGIEYTTAGLTSIADFQARGYQYIQP
jgi:intracellular sulfur oxidation DsrE/DsrF family protein